MARAAAKVVVALESAAVEEVRQEHPETVLVLLAEDQTHEVGRGAGAGLPE